MSVEFGLGALKSPFDARDYPITAAPDFALAPTAFPPTYSLPPLVPVALNQMNDPVSGGCVPFSTTTMKQYQERQQTGHWYYNDDSAIRLHRRCKQIDGTPGEGTFPRVALQVAKAEGIRAMNGHNYLIASYYSLQDGDQLANIKKTLTFYKRPVLLSTSWYSNWFGLGRNYTLKPPNGQIVGGHQITVYGYAVQPSGVTHLRCINSWGTGWGNKGRFSAPWPYFQPWDLWATIDR